MASQLLSSRVAIEEEEPRVRPIQAIQTSIACMVGVTERGPINVPTLVTSFDEYEAIFGGFTADSDVALAANGFFENEGQFLYVIRTVHHTDITNPASQTGVKGTLNLQTAAGAATPAIILGTNTEPFDFEPGEQLSIDVDGGGAALATFDATAGERTAANAPTYALADGQTLLVSVDGGAAQTITFLAVEVAAIGAVTLAEALAIINAKITGAFAQDNGGNPQIVSDTRGTNSGIEITGGTAAAAFAFPAGNGPGTGDVADIDAVTVAEIKVVVEADIAGLLVTDVGGAVQIQSLTTGLGSSLQVALGNIQAALGLTTVTITGGSGAAVNTLQVDGKTEGDYTGLLTIRIDPATSGVADEFNLVVLDDGVVTEIFANLSMTDTADRFVEAIVNDPQLGIGSNLIAVTDLDAVASTQRPANGTFGPLTGGDDGLTGLVDIDFLGSEAGPTGLRTLDVVQVVNILLIPGRATSAVQNGMITYAEVTREKSMFAVLDPPAGLSATAVITYFRDTAQLVGLSEFGAAYWPRVEILNPSTAIFGTVERITVPPSGIIAGVYARTDGSREGGVYLPPAGIEEGRLIGVLGFETNETLDRRKRDLVEPQRINPLTTFPGAPNHIGGSYTLKADGNFPFVSQRRGAIFIEQSIKNGIEFARNKNNTPGLRRTVERTIRGFLIIQMKKGAFASQDPDTAFFVDFGPKLNTPLIVNSGQMIGRVGLAFNTPAVWIVVRFSRDQRALEQEIAGG